MLLAQSQLYPFVIRLACLCYLFLLFNDISVVILLISAISSLSGYLACIETNVVKNAFCIFPKATPNAKSFSCYICSALFEGSKNTFTMLGIAITTESIYCSRSPLIVASIAIAFQVCVIIYGFKVKYTDIVKC